MPPSNELRDAIAALWGEARPRLLARAESLEAAAAGPLGEPELARARIDAHTLAGTLGAFGKPDATAAARDAERALAAGDRPGLLAAIRTLRAEIER